jgi:predicted Ser/Thr protein kinase
MGKHGDDDRPTTEVTQTEVASATPPRSRDRGGPIEVDGQVGRYRVVRRLGAGGMGVVYEARDPDLDRDVAVKLLHGEGDEALQRRLLREAQAMARISHRNLVTVYDVGTHRGRVFVAMELVRGQTLRQWLERERRPWPDAVRVFLEAGRGLAAAHAAGVVHRDFKPDNVLVADSGRVLVVDFGLARGVGEASDTPQALAPSTDVLASPLTRTGAVLGTPAYMSPEQHLGRPADMRSDQFGFAVALYEAIYGQRPFPGDTHAELYASVTAGERSRLPAEPRVPARLIAVLERGLQLDPEARFPDIEALLAELEALVRPPRRWPWAAIAAAAVAMATGVGVTYAVVHTAGPAAPPDAGPPKDPREMAFEFARMFLEKEGIEGALELAHRLDRLDRDVPRPPPAPPGVSELPALPNPAPVMSNRQELVVCLEDIELEPGLVVLLRAEVDELGRVTRASVKHSDAPAAVSACVAGAVRGWEVADPGEPNRERLLPVPLDLVRPGR